MFHGLSPAMECSHIAPPSLCPRSAAQSKAALWLLKIIPNTGSCGRTYSMVSIPKISGTFAPSPVLSPPPVFFPLFLLSLIPGIWPCPWTPKPTWDADQITSYLFTWKGTSDIVRPLEYPQFRREAGRWRKWLRRCWESRGGSKACVCLLVALHLMPHKALGYSGLGTGRGPGNQNCYLRMWAQCPPHWRTLVEAALSVGGRPRKQRWARPGEDGHDMPDGAGLGTILYSEADTVLQRRQIRGILATILPSYVHDRHH